MEQKIIDAAIVRIRENKEKCVRMTAFGDDNHTTLDAYLKVLEEGLDDDDCYDEWEDEDQEREQQGAIEIVYWRDNNESLEELEKFLFPEKE